MNVLYLILALLGIGFLCSVAWLYSELMNAPEMPSDDNELFYEVNKKG